jgi:hypothetical protein
MVELDTGTALDRQETWKPIKQKGCSTMNDDFLMRGTVCPICGERNPNGYYRQIDGNQRICNKHSEDQINKWICKPAKPEPKIKKWER